MYCNGEQAAQVRGLPDSESGVGCLLTVAHRKTREVDLNRAKDSPGDVSDDNAYKGDEGSPHLSGFTIPDTYQPGSPSHRSVDLENDQHVPHLICSFPFRLIHRAAANKQQTRPKDTV